jgi:hypothetical protein
MRIVELEIVHLEPTFIKVPGWDIQIGAKRGSSQECQDNQAHKLTGNEALPTLSLTAETGRQWSADC